MEFKQFEKLDNYLRMYAGGHIEERYHFLRNGTEEQKEDLLSFIIYLRGNLLDHKNKNRMIAGTVIHDILGINKNDIHFVPKSTGYSKTISITKL